MRKIGDVRTIDRTPCHDDRVPRKKRDFSLEPQKQIPLVFAGYVLYPPLDRLRLSIKRILQHDRLHPIRAGGNDRDGRTNQLFQTPQVLLRSQRQLAE